MIAALHAAGIGVIMDVVYNHMYRNENALNNTVPYYFFRQNEDGSFSNGSGCGNDCQRAPHGPEIYDRFHALLGAGIPHRRLRTRPDGPVRCGDHERGPRALDALPGGGDILMYGEPWQGGGSQLHRYEANKANLSMLNDRIGIFCDDTRDAIKGGCFDAREPGYVEGKPGSFWDVGGAVAAWCRSDRLPPHAPSRIVSYVSAHDNFTLWTNCSACATSGRSSPHLTRWHWPRTGWPPARPHQSRLALPAGGRKVCPHQKGVGNSYHSSPP